MLHLYLSDKLSMKVMKSNFDTSVMLANDFAILLSMVIKTLIYVVHPNSEIKRLVTLGNTDD